MFRECSDTKSVSSVRSKDEDTSLCINKANSLDFLCYFCLENKDFPRDMPSLHFFSFCLILRRLSNLSCVFLIYHFKHTLQMLKQIVVLSVSVTTMLTFTRFGNHHYSWFFRWNVIHHCHRSLYSRIAWRFLHQV